MILHTVQEYLYVEREIEVILVTIILNSNLKKIHVKK